MKYLYKENPIYLQQGKVMLHVRPILDWVSYFNGCKKIEIY